MVLGEVVVDAPQSGPLPSTSVFSSVDILGPDMIEKQNVRDTWQLYNQLPGVQVTSFGQGAWSGRPSFRGFNGEGELNAVKLLIDGVPSNANDGSMPYLDMVFPLEIETIEVVRGTNDPRYGLHSIAGNTQVATKTGGNLSEARVGLGSFNTRQVQAAQGFESGGVSQNYFVGWQDSDGYRDHAEAEKRAVSGKWFYTTPDSGHRLGLIARTYKVEAQEPGYLTRSQIRADERQSMAHNATDGGVREMSQVSGHADLNLSDRLSLATKAYVNSYADDRWVRFSSRVSQQERITDETHMGALATMTWRPEAVPVIHGLALEGGINFEHQENESQRFSTANRVRTAMTRNQQFDLDNTGAYVQAVVQPIRALKLIPAWRTDWLNGGLTDRMTGQGYAMNDYGAINQPKFSAVFSPVDEYSLYGNWGRTFQVGVGAAAYKVGQATDLEPSINDGWEVGVKFRPLKGMDGRVALWEQVATNEARRKLNDPSNSSENIGKTRRNGIDLELGVMPVEKLRLWAGYSYQESEILRADTSAPASLGKEIDHVPHHLFNAGAEYALTEQWSLNLQAHGQSDYYVERTNSTDKFGDYLLFDLGAVYQFDSRFSFDLQVKNLTDARYEYVWYETVTGQPSQTMHSAGDGLGIYAGFNLKM